LWQIVMEGKILPKIAHEMYKAFSLLDDVLVGAFQGELILKLSHEELIRRIRTLLDDQEPLCIYHQLKVKSLQHSIRQLVIMEEKWVLSMGYKGHPATRQINHRLLEKFSALVYHKLKEVPYRFQESARLVNLRRRRDHFSLTFQAPLSWEHLSHQELAFLYLDLSLYRQYTQIKESIREQCFLQDSLQFGQFVQKLHKFYASSMYNAIRHLGYPLSVKEWEIPACLNPRHFSQKGLFYTEKLMRFLETEYADYISQLDLASPKAIVRTWHQLLPAIQVVHGRMLAGEIPCAIARELQRLHLLLHQQGFHGNLTHHQLQCMRRMGMDLLDRSQHDHFPSTLRDWIRFFLHHNANQPTMVQAIIQDMESYLQLLHHQGSPGDWLRQLRKCIQQTPGQPARRYALEDPDLQTQLAHWVQCELDHMQPVLDSLAEPSIEYNPAPSHALEFQLFQKELLTLIRLLEESGVLRWTSSRKDLFRHISRHLRTRGSDQPLSEASLDKAWYSISSRDYTRAAELLAELLSLAQKNARR
jgi:hypothetical protein